MIQYIPGSIFRASFLERGVAYLVYTLYSVQSTMRPLLPCTVHAYNPYMPAIVTAVMTDDCVHLLSNSSWKLLQHAAGQLLSWQPVRYGKGRRYGPFITNKIAPPAGSLSSSQPGGPPCWTSPLAFDLIGYNLCLGITHVRKMCKVKGLPLSC
jgi:hypothetical protein